MLGKFRLGKFSLGKFMLGKYRLVKFRFGQVSFTVMWTIFLFLFLDFKQCYSGWPSRQHWGEIGGSGEDSRLQEQQQHHQREVPRDRQRGPAHQTSHQHRVKQKQKNIWFYNEGKIFNDKTFLTTNCRNGYLIS